MIELQARGARLPFYFLHGDVIGGGFYVRDLSRLLGEDQPFYVLPPVEIPDGALPTVEVMATQHLKDLRAHRPNGPYLLGGFCIGGLIAYEMALPPPRGGRGGLIRCADRSRIARRVFAWPPAPGAMADEDGAPSRRDKPPACSRAATNSSIGLREEWNAPFRDKIRFAAAKVRALFGGNDADHALSVRQGQSKIPATTRTSWPPFSGFSRATCRRVMMGQSRFS